MTDRAKALYTGTLFNGTADCYVLEDGRRVLSQRGAARVLSKKAGGKGARENAVLTPYLDNLSKVSSGLSARADFVEFDRPDGGHATGIVASDFVALLDAYVDAGLNGLLRANQIHLARNAAATLKALQRVGLDALIDEATGYERVKGDDLLAQRMQAYLRDHRGPYRITWPQALRNELLRLYGYAGDGTKRWPQWMRSPIDKIYRTIYGDDIKDELKVRNPNPHYGSSHPQWLEDNVGEMFREVDIHAVVTIAATSLNVEDFWGRLAWNFQRRSHQPPLLPNTKKKSRRKPKAA